MTPREVIGEVSVNGVGRLGDEVADAILAALAAEGYVVEPMANRLYEYDAAILTVEGVTVANHMLRELMQAMGESDHARPESPGVVWMEMLAKLSAAGETDG